MNKGYITIAQNTDTVNYLEQAYALALSLRLSQSGVNKLSVCVDDATKRQLTPKHHEVFDHIIDIPWGDSAKDHNWKIHNKWKYYHMTPYDETVILDADMIFPTDVSHWWNYLCERDVWVTTNVKTYRGEPVISDHYRRTFTVNQLPNAYTAFMYFKKSQLASELFAMAEIVFQHWQRFFYVYMPENKPDFLSGDVAFALSMKILGIEDLCTNNNAVHMPTFTHMKSYAQNVKGITLNANWTKSLPTYYVNFNNFKVANFRQTLPFHYVEPEWLTPQIIKNLEASV